MNLAAWFLLGWLPFGGFSVYDPPSFTDVAGSYLVELGVEVSWGPLFVGGSMQVPTWKCGILDFWPSQLVSTFDAGLEWKGIRLGWHHTCSHPVVPLLVMIGLLDEQLVPNWDSSYDMIYLKVETRRKDSYENNR